MKKSALRSVGHGKETSKLFMEDHGKLPRVDQTWHESWGYKKELFRRTHRKRARERKRYWTGRHVELQLIQCSWSTQHLLRRRGDATDLQAWANTKHRFLLNVSCLVAGIFICSLMCWCSTAPDMGEVLNTYLLYMKKNERVSDPETWTLSWRIEGF